MESTTVLRGYLWAVVVLVVGCLLSITLFALARSVEDRKLEDEFAVLKEDRLGALRMVFKEQPESIEELRDLFLASARIEGSRFTEVALAALLRHESARAFAWCPRVTHAEIGALTAAAKQDGLGDFQLRERNVTGVVAAGTRSEYAPVYFLTGGTADLPLALGFDLLSQPAWKAALERARDQGALSLLGCFPLSGGAGPQQAALLALPLYRSDAAHSTREERQQSLRGWVLGIISLDDLMRKGATRIAQDKLHLTLQEDARASSPVLFSSLEPMDLASAVVVPVTDGIRFGDRQLALVCRPSAAFVATFHTWYGIAPLIGGMAVSLLVAAVLAFAGFRQGRTERLFVEQSSALRVKETEHARSEAALSVALSENAILAAAVANTTTGVTITDPNQNDNPVIFVNKAFASSTGYSAEEAVGRNLRFLQGSKTDAMTVTQIREAVTMVRPYRGEVLNYRKNGTTF
jgi:PAS domain S-box-containing protein